jgi:Mg-chelatase subunit ChlD
VTRTTREPRVPIALLALTAFTAGWCLLTIGTESADAEDLRGVGGAHRVYLDDIIPPSSESLKNRLYVRAESSSGRPLIDLDPDQIVIFDNGTAIEANQIEVTTIEQARRGTAAVLVLDTSLSMRGPAFDRSKQAALRYLEQMGESDQIAIISFNDDVEVIGDFGTPRETLQERITALGVQKKTLAKRVWDGVRRGLELVGASRDALPRRVFMIVFSDGRDSASKAPPESLLEAAVGGPGRARTPIFSYGFMGFGDAGLDGLEQMSQRTGASMYRFHPTIDPAGFFADLDEISFRMNQSLVVSYPAQADGELHALEIQIESATDSRTATYPAADARNWSWAVISILLLGIGVVSTGAIRMKNLRPSGELVITGGEGADQSFSLGQRSIAIGALDDNDIVLNIETVSRHHARLTFEAGGVRLKDLDSRNGTFINDRRTYTKGSIHSGDRIRLGDVELTYRA